VSHIVDAHCNSQDENVILARIDRNPIAVAQAGPLFGYFRHFVATFADGVLWIRYSSFCLHPAFTLRYYSLNLDNKPGKATRKI
jgi:hypothetical protein